MVKEKGTSIDIFFESKADKEKELKDKLKSSQKLWPFRDYNEF